MKQGRRRTLEELRREPAYQELCRLLDKQSTDRIELFCEHYDGSADKGGPDDEAKTGDDF